MYEFTLPQVNHYILEKHHLTPKSQGIGVLQITQDIAGLHATGAIEPYLTLFARSIDFTRDQLDKALTVDRNLVKFRYVRGTLYLLTHAMVPIAYSALHSLVESQSTRYMIGMKVSLAEYNQVSRKVMQLLRDGQQSISEIKTAVGGDLHLPSIITLMCDQALLARVHTSGNWKAHNYKYARFSDYFKGLDLIQYSESEAIRLLVQAYIHAFGPVTEEDIFWWIGLPRNKIRPALEELRSQLVNIKLEGFEDTLLMFGDDIPTLKNTLPGEQVVNVLPTLDPYLMGYKRRFRYLDYRHLDYIFDRAGNVTTTILVDGMICGIWDIEGIFIKVHLFDRASRKIRTGIYEKLEAMGGFITGSTVKVKNIDKMTPLTQRNAGGFMSPLKIAVE